MSAFAVCARTTLLITTNGNTKHLFIVINDPHPTTGQVLIVPIITDRQGQGFTQDTTCRLRKGDHPFIRRDSLVDYRNARLVTARQLEDGVAQGLFIVREHIDEGILLQICDGIEQSSLTSLEHKDFYLSVKE